MAKFKCKNCKNEFEKFCDKLEDSLDVECPSCKSHWIESIFEEEKKDHFIFPTLPYSDPPYPQPWIGDPPYPQPWIGDPPYHRPGTGDPFPPSGYKFWCTMNKARRSDW